MANQIRISAGAKVRDLEGVLIGTVGVVSSLPINASNGIPQLDVNGKILVSQLPNSVMEYKGTWSAATNTPTLADGTGNQGDVYLCNVAGTVNFGAGAIPFFVGDSVIYSGTIWQKASGATGTVTSVAASITGSAVGVTGSPVTTSGTLAFAFAGTNLQYVNGAGNLTTFPILTGYVPYTGATQDVDLGVYDISGAMATFTADVFGLTGFYTQNTVDTFLGSSNNYSGMIVNGTTGVTKIVSSGDANITIASGGAALFSSTITATSLIKSGGTSGQFLKANGSVDSSVYALDSAVVHLAGTETITGAKTFSGGVTFSSSVTTNNLTFANSGFFLTLQPPTLSVNRTVTLPNGTGTLALTSDISYPVTSVFGRTGAVVAASADYNTSQVTELTNLYYTEARVNANTNVAANTAARHNALTLGTANGLSLSTQVLSLALATTSVTGALSSADWTIFNNKQSTISLTTTGTSGAAVLVGNTLNIPNYGSALSGYLPLTGGTLTGALGGTTATFTGSVSNRLTLNSTSADGGYITLQKSGVDKSYIQWNYNSAGNASGNHLLLTNITASGSIFLQTLGNTTALEVNSSGNTILTGALTGTSATFSTEVTSSGSQGRFGGWATGAGYQGAAIEMGVSGGVATLIGYNRTGGVYIPLSIGGGTNQTTTIGGNTILLQNNSVTTLTLASTGAATFSSSVTSTITANAAFSATSATTSRIYSQWANSGGNAFFGIESSTGGSLFTGSSAYATVLGTDASKSLQFATNNTIRLSIDNAGAATFSTSVTATKLIVGTDEGYALNITTSGYGALIKSTGSSANIPLVALNSATTGSNILMSLQTDANVERASFRYDRTGDRLQLVASGSGLLVTGAATFSSSVTLNSNSTITIGTNAISGLTLIDQPAQTGASRGVNYAAKYTTAASVAGHWSFGSNILAVDGSWELYNSAGAVRFGITPSGAATFSSTIKTAGFGSTTARTWKLGELVTATVIGVNTTGYISIEVNGSQYNLALANLA